MAICFLWDLSQHHCCLWVGGEHLHVHVQILLPGFSLNEQSLLLKYWNGPVSNGCLFSFPHIPVLLPSFSQGIFFTFLLGGSCEVRGAVWPSCWEAALLSWLCHSHRHQPSCHSRVEGLKKRKRQNKNHLLFLACCLLVFISQTWKWERRKQLSIFVCWQSQDWTFNSSFIHHHQFCLQIWPH